MNDSEWRLKLDTIRKRIALDLQEEFLAQTEAQILRVIHVMEQDYIEIYRPLLEGIDVAYDRLSIDPQAEADPRTIAFDILATQARGEASQGPGLERARSERDAARETAGGVNIEFLIRAWLGWRMKG